MKKVIQFLCLISCFLKLQACVVSIGVPESLCAENTALMIYFQDVYGKEFIGKCTLSQTSTQQIIAQSDLKITEAANVAHFDTIADVTNISAQSAEVVILHVEIDCTMKVLKILVVQDSFLADTMFDVWTLSLSERNEFEMNNHRFSEFENEQDSLDNLTALAELVDTQKLDDSLQHAGQVSTWQKYVVLAEIYMLMQYGRVKRAMQSWFVQ
ncbi:hypothetical protein KAZ82_00795 [Candidatus Babeliales bacterium]|nr:hypothetical protein [Candidatus Babeliales bacterium]